MRRILGVIFVAGFGLWAGTGCFEKKAPEVVVTADLGEETPAPEVEENVDEEAEARLAAAIAAAKAKRAEALDPKAPIDVSLGLKADGEVIVQWAEGLNYSVTSEGSANNEGGATVSAKLGNGFEAFDLTLALVLKVADEKLVVSGTYESTVPFRVTMLGSGATSAEAEGLSGEAGSGPFEYEAPVPVFFEVLQKE